MVIASAEEFVRLRESDDMNNYNRAATESASLEVWKDIINRFPNMKCWVIHNKTVPLEILQVLAKDTDQEVRWWVASKNMLSIELFDLLSNDSDESVRKKIACNKNVPKSILETLLKDSSPVVAEIARERIQKGLFRKS